MLEEMATIPVPTAQLPSITSLITKVNDATQQNPQNSCKQTLFTQSSTPHSSGHEFSNADGDIMNRKRIHLEQPPITPARWYEAHMGGTPAIPIASLPPPPPVPPPVPPPPSQAALVAAGAVSHHQDAEPMVIEMDDSGPTTPKVGNIDANTHGVQNMVIQPLIRQFHHHQQQHHQQQQFQSMMAVPFVQQPSPIAHSFPQPLQPAIIERVPSATPLRDNPPSTSIAVTSAAATSTTTATTATASVTSSATSPALPTLYPQPYAVTFSVSERALLTDDELKIIPGAARSSKPNWIQDVRQYLLQHPEAVQQRTQRSQQLSQMSSQTLAKMKQQSIERYKEIREQEREKTTAKQNGSPNEQQKQQPQKRSPKQQQQQQQQQQQGQQQQKKRTRAVSETASAATKIDATTTTAAGAGTKTRPPRLVIPPPQSQLAGRLWSPGGSTLTSAAVTARASPSIGTNGNVQIKTEVAASTDSTLTHGQHTPPSATSASSSSSSRRRLPVVRGSRIIFTATNSADLELQTAARGNPTAQSLILQNEPQLTACSLFRIAPALQSLHTLHVLSCAKFSIDGITRVVSECPTLRTFAYRMDTAPTTDQSLALLRALPRELVTLSLEFKPAKLYQQQRQATSKFQYDMQTIFGQYWPNIETLILVCNERLDSLYPMIAKVCPGLTRLRIAGALARSLSSSASGISTPASATVLSSSPPSSSSFSSSTTVDCNKKVAEHLAHFPAAIKELIIDVSNKQPLKDSILPDSLTPTYLNVGNALMTTHGMYRLIMSPALRTLVVTGVTFCKLGEIRTAERFVEYLTNSNSVNKAKRSSSKSLNSANESAASSTSVAAAAATTVEEMSTVRVLKIRGGSGLTAVWLTGMAKLMPELDRIELAGVSGLPESDITEFKKAHPSAKVVVTSSFTPTIFPF
ncbi:hypothetical protein GQ42DRAFT_153381 [Ramicandelaber brevisporus]|nr:hypothetical protein GQ42DRAFT_153381 [Ramicandelaber brevisporus]